MTPVESYHYDPRKDVVHIPGCLWGPLGEQRLQLAFDPGAYRSIIDTRVIDGLGYQAKPESQRISTSSIIGTEVGYSISVERLSILTFAFSDFSIACFDLPEKYGIDGLIGLDLLTNFEVTLRHRDRWIQFRLLD